jgi:hypothetical protein
MGWCTRSTLPPPRTGPTRTMWLCRSVSPTCSSRCVCRCVPLGERLAQWLISPGTDQFRVQQERGTAPRRQRLPSPRLPAQTQSARKGPFKVNCETKCPEVRVPAVHSRCPFCWDDEPACQRLALPWFVVRWPHTFSNFPQVWFYFLITRQSPVCACNASGAFSPASDLRPQW